MAVKAFPKNPNAIILLKRRIDLDPQPSI